tara:strand:- start:758 stop:1801 length:1044 start_codon:yes stop_codon:yes gene_type:complete
MSYFKNLTNDDRVNDVAIVTSGLFQDGSSNITTFFTSSTQYTNTGDYNIDVYKHNPAGNASASVQFGLVYGHVGGSGSLGTKGATGDRTTAAVYGQFNNLINPPQTTRFTFGPKTDVQHFYALSFNRARIREKVEPGGWELHLSGSGGTVKLIDDSSTNKAGTSNQRNFSPEFNVVSGTLIGGTTINTAASSEPAASGSYGTFYPSLGVILLNPARISGSGAQGSSGTIVSTVEASNTDSRNHRNLFDSIKLGKYFQAKRQEEVTSRHFFVRATAKDFNATTNETYYTESTAGVKQIISGLRTDPKTYITTVGMYNDDNELLAIAKLSQPILKSKSREALIKVKLDF